MDQNSCHRTIVAFVGMPGSGKSEASNVAREMGLKVIIMGDVVREETDRLGLDHTDRNHGMVANGLRQTEGPEAIARRCMSKLDSSCQVVIDGVRSLEEVEYFRTHCERFDLVEIFTEPMCRIKRIASRGRCDDGPCTDANSQDLSGVASALLERDDRELGWGLCRVMESADLQIVNDGTCQELRDRIKAYLKQILDGKTVARQTASR